MGRQSSNFVRSHWDAIRSAAVGSGETRRARKTIVDASQIVASASRTRRRMYALIAPGAGGRGHYTSGSEWLRRTGRGPGPPLSPAWWQGAQREWDAGG